MKNIEELRRSPSPAGRPQPLAFHAGRLWVGSWDTDKLYAIDPATWVVAAEIDAPGKPYGMTEYQGGISVVVALDDDDRYLFRFDPERGFDVASKTACPDVTGSHLAANGDALYLCQQGLRRILELDAHATVRREIPLTTRCGGIGFDQDGHCFMISADQEFEKLEFARLDVNDSAPRPAPIASIDAEARALTFDGRTWWTSCRDANEIVAFSAAAP
jgi:hypothetical protein